MEKKELEYICKDLKLLGDEVLTKKALFIYSVLSDNSEDIIGVDISYSYIMRKLRKEDDEKRLKFQQVFKSTFDDALYNNLENPDKIALLAAMHAIDFEDK